MRIGYFKWRKSRCVPPFPFDEKQSKQFTLRGEDCFGCGAHPIRDATIPRSAKVSPEAHAATPDEALAIMDALKTAGEMKARAAVALMFFAGLRPGEARGAIGKISTAGS